MVPVNSMFLLIVLVILQAKSSLQKFWFTSDELENHISPEDLKEFMQIYNSNSSTTTPKPNAEYADIQDTTTHRLVPELVDCFGLGSISGMLLKLFNMKPDDPEKVNTHFYFSSRDRPIKVQVYPDNQFGLEWVDFNPNRKTVVIVHGFMSHSNASWVNDMTRAFLEWGDVNVIAVDWSGGGNTWKYWRAVANTRRVGSDMTRFLRQLIQATGANIKDFHFIGHSLGAHISSFASYHLGKVSRITGLDPAQPCFASASEVERLSASDADFVDIIHTNGRLLQQISFGIPEPMGHVDFYPNGGLKQPGCVNTSRTLWDRVVEFTSAKLQQAVCSHGRAYVLFTESLINNNCTFQAYRWDLSYEGVNKSLNSTCDLHGSCAEMGIKADGERGHKPRGPYFLLTTDKEPYCVSEPERRRPILEVLRDLSKGFLHRITSFSTRPTPTVNSVYADPLNLTNEERSLNNDGDVTTTTQKSWFKRLFGS